MLLPLLVLLAAATAQPAPPPPATVYDLLPKYGLPPGLLPTLSPLLLLRLAVAATAMVQPAPPPPETVYGLLPKYGIPSGLLPDSVTSFSLADDGAFEVELAGPCYIDFEYLIYYTLKITGVIKYGGFRI